MSYDDRIVPITTANTRASRATAACERKRAPSPFQNETLIRQVVTPLIVRPLPENSFHGAFAKWCSGSFVVVALDTSEMSPEVGAG